MGRLDRAWEGRRVAVVVAHPDDETLWAGGLLLMHPEWEVSIVGLTHGGDPVRSPRFRCALGRLGARGALADMEDGGREDPVPEGEMEARILERLPRAAWDLVLTHSPVGEYTEHQLHDEVSDAVGRLLAAGRMRTAELWHFAYDDAGGGRLPEARRDATERVALPEDVWLAKRRIVTDVYGFGEEAWETRTTPRVEGFQAVDEGPDADGDR